MMRDVLNTYEEDGEYPSFHDPHDDPFYDMMEPLLIGQAYYKLEPLAYLIDNPTTSKLVSQSFAMYGTVDVNIIPCDPSGQDEPAEELIPDEPEDLLNQSIDFIVDISKAEQLPKDFCKDVYCEYTFYLDETPFRTTTVKSKNQNPEFNYRRQHTVGCVTELMLKHLKNDCLVIKLFGYPDIKRSGGQKALQKSTSYNEDSTMDRSKNSSMF